MPIQIVRFIIHLILSCKDGSPAPTGHGHPCRLSVVAVEHPGRHVVPHVIEGIVPYAQVEQVQLPAENRKFVVQRPQGLAAFRTREHILFAALGHCVIQEREDRYQFRCRLDIQIVHAHGGDDALRVVSDGVAQFP